MDLTNIVLEMQDRIIRLEKEVSQLKMLIQKNGNEQSEAMSLIKNFEEEKNCNSNNIQNNVKTRDKTRYRFNGTVYLKNRLVLAVVQEYVQEHKLVTKEELSQIFPKQLQGSIGVVVNIEVAKMRSDYKIRFFAEENEILHLADGDMVVCSQWGILNIPNFVERASHLGYNIIENK